MSAVASEGSGPGHGEAVSTIARQQGEEQRAAASERGSNEAPAEQRSEASQARADRSGRR